MMNFDSGSTIDIRYSKLSSPDLLLSIGTRENAYARICQTSAASQEEPRLRDTLGTVGRFVLISAKTL
jgi:hypothetical protein